MSGGNDFGKRPRFHMMKLAMLRPTITFVTALLFTDQLQIGVETSTTRMVPRLLIAWLQ